MRHHTTASQGIATHVSPDGDRQHGLGWHSTSQLSIVGHNERTANSNNQRYIKQTASPPRAQDCLIRVRQRSVDKAWDGALKVAVVGPELTAHMQAHITLGDDTSCMSMHGTQQQQQLLLLLLLQLLLLLLT